MKTFKGTFANGQQYMGVRVPNSCCFAALTFNDKQKYYISTWGLDELQVAHIDLPSGEYDGICGFYQTKGKIDFEAKEEWVYRHPSQGFYYPSGEALPKRYIDYTCNGAAEHGGKWHESVEQSLLSLLDRDSRIAFPLEDEMEGWADGIIEGLTYKQHKEKVRPKTFLIILVK